ncbi:hypothetical protein SLEP1_g52318 [Rubroshorea leprosula]|uniref:Carboxypeptidase n=1 Tax=Rubroshorea leprosula TaxID=152421 RepID=A0AAV5M6P5_9ROSI|nr:hypothetical protein SLEP1_g52318 [Rubroshorea leprosula]
MKSNQWMFITITVVFATFMQIWVVVESLSQADKIVALPGQPKVSFGQFSGYIFVDDQKQRALFYYFVEAETDPSSKPLVLWLNGGPGCSSFGAGAFVEHGPFKTNGETLVSNDFSWNKAANMLYLESPAGVGFSYSTNKSFYPDLGDKITARDNLVFLQRWFLEFPEYKNRDFYITGESYAGHYVPQLAQLFIQTDMKPNLKGIAIGNPLIEFTTDMNSVDDFYWSHGLISDSAYELVKSLCNNSQLMREALEGFLSPACADVYLTILEELSHSIDKYDVLADVCLSSANGSQTSLLSHPAWSRLRHVTSLQSQQTVLNQQQVSGEKADVCAEDKTTKYLNRKDVQVALHAKLVRVTTWSLCNKFVQYRRNIQDPTIQILASLVKSGIRVLVYSGDQDSVIPFTGTRTLIYKLAKEFGLKTTVPYRAWFESKQVGGWTQVYGDILSYAIIRGASHTAPATQPERSLTLFKAFLAGKPLPED